MLGIPKTRNPPMLFVYTRAIRTRQIVKREGGARQIDKLKTRKWICKNNSRSSAPAAATGSSIIITISSSSSNSSTVILCSSTMSMHSASCRRQSRNGEFCRHQKCRYFRDLLQKFPKSTYSQYCVPGEKQTFLPKTCKYKATWGLEHPGALQQTGRG